MMDNETNSAVIKIIFREYRRNDEGKHEEAPKVDVKTLHSGD